MASARSRRVVYPPSTFPWEKNDPPIVFKPNTAELCALRHKPSFTAKALEDDARSARDYGRVALQLQWLKAHGHARARGDKFTLTARGKKMTAKACDMFWKSQTAEGRTRASAKFMSREAVRVRARKKRKR